MGELFIDRRLRLSRAICLVFLAIVCWGSSARAADGDVAGPSSLAAPASRPAETSASEDLNRTTIHRTPSATGGPTTAPATAVAPTLDLGRVAMALAAVIALIFFLRWGSRKILAIPSSGNGSQLMQVVARTTLAPRQQLLLIRVGQRLMVVGESAGHLSSLGQITDADEVALLIGQIRAPGTPPMAAATFGSLYRRLRRRFGAADTPEDWEGDDFDKHEQVSNERQELLDAFSSEQNAAAAADSHRQKRGIADSPQQVGFDESEAQEAVQAARMDIKALRARLRQVSQSLTEPGDVPSGPLKSADSDSIDAGRDPSDTQ